MVCQNDTNCSRYAKSLENSGFSCEENISCPALALVFQPMHYQCTTQKVCPPYYLAPSVYQCGPGEVNIKYSDGYLVNNTVGCFPFTILTISKHYACVEQLETEWYIGTKNITICDMAKETRCPIGSNIQEAEEFGKGAKLCGIGRVYSNYSCQNPANSTLLRTANGELVPIANCKIVVAGRCLFLTCSAKTVFVDGKCDSKCVGTLHDGRCVFGGRAEDRNGWKW